MLEPINTGLPRPLTTAGFDSTDNTAGGAVDSYRVLTQREYNPGAALNLDSYSDLVSNRVNVLDKRTIAQTQVTTLNHRQRQQSTQDTLTGINRGESLVTTTSLRRNSGAVRGRQTISESLSWGDSLNPTRLNCYKDDYLLQSSSSGSFQINLSSSEFDTYLQVVDNRTGTVIASNDDSGFSTNSQLTLNVQAGVSYTVRVTSYGAYETGNYTLNANPLNTPQPPTTRFNSTYGYGLVDAASAVARVINTAPFTPAPGTGQSWSNQMVNAPTVWARGYTGRNVVVAVVDTGVDYTHRDLDANIWRNTREIAGNGIDDDRNGYVDDVRGWDFVNSDNNPMDDQGHGTHVAGTIAAENNGSGITGVAYNARIMPIRVLGTNGGTNRNVALGIRYAVNNGANVINLSLGGGYSAEVESAIQYASSRGAIVVTAAGNEGLAQPGHPAQSATRWGLSVGAVDSSRTITSFSNRAGSDSRMQHIVAPGANIYSTVPGNRYQLMNGTSMAAPHVAGVVALMLQANPRLTDSQVRQIITETTVPLGTTGLSTSSLPRTRSNGRPQSIQRSIATTSPSQSLESDLFAVARAQSFSDSEANGAIAPKAIAEQTSTTASAEAVFSSSRWNTQHSLSRNTTSLQSMMAKDELLGQLPQVA